jgi:thiol-disulfide isomerase/thioredoxin
MLRLVTTIGATLLAAAAAVAASISGPAPGFALERRSGGQMSLDELEGQVVMINFWATWCVPCREEMPHLEALYQRYSSLGFTLLGVNVEDDKQGAEKFLKSTPVSFPILYDPESKVSTLYKVQAMPTTVLVGRDGSMRFIHHGYKAGYENDYQTQIRALLRE